MINPVIKLNLKSFFFCIFLKLFYLVSDRLSEKRDSEMKLWLNFPSLDFDQPGCHTCRTDKDQDMKCCPV